MKLGADERELIVPREAGTGYFWLGLTSEQLGMYEVTKDAATGSERFSFAWLDLASKDLHRLDLERWVEPRFSFSADLGGVAYVMKDTSLTPPRSRVFVYERGKEELSRLPLEELGLQGYVLKGWSGLSGNGRYLAFSGVEQESAEEQTDEHDFNDIYLFDRDTAQLSRLGTGDYAALSDDAGIVVLWNSDAHTEREQLRILDRDAGTLMDLCELPEDLPCICSLSGTDLSTAAIPAECREDACPSLTLQAECSMPQVSSDGRHVAFELALHGGSRDASSWRYALAVYDVASGRSALIEATKSMRGTSSDWQLSRDGRFLVFTSSSPTLGVQDGVPNVFLAPLPCFD
jgi:dipeptidyl aminopeptidase/acylaminoacyl peptidase